MQGLYWNCVMGFGFRQLEQGISSQSQTYTHKWQRCGHGHPPVATSPPRVKPFWVTSYLEGLVHPTLIALQAAHKVVRLLMEQTTLGHTKNNLLFLQYIFLIEMLFS